MSRPPIAWIVLCLLVLSGGCLEAPTFQTGEVASDVATEADTDGACLGEACTAAPCSNDLDCSNGDLCDGVESCQGGVCVAGVAVECSQASAGPCAVNACNPTTGSCEISNASDGTACDDGLDCTVESCSAGTCAAEAQEGGCAIGGTCYQDGATAPDDSCAVCAPERSQSAWSSAALLNKGLGYFDGTTATLQATDSCHRIALGCDRCASPTQPTVTLNLAANAEASIFSVSVVWLDEQIRVGQPKSEAPFTFRGAAEAALVSPDRIVAVRLTEPATPKFVAQLVTIVGELGLAQPDRPLIVRANSDLLEALDAVRAGFDDVASLAPFVRYHVLVDSEQSFATYAAQVGAISTQIHAVEVEVVDHPLGMAKLRYARGLGLGTGARLTVQGVERAVLLTALRDLVDFVMVTAPQPGDAARLRGASNLLQVDLSRQQIAHPESVDVLFEGALQSLDTTAEGPSLVGVSPFDGSPVIDFTGSRVLPLFDADNDTGGGYIVTALVELSSVDPSPVIGDHFQGFITKAEGSSFSLEVQHLFSPPTVQFAARLFDTYAIASHPLPSVPLNQPVWLVGAYRGDGMAYLWMDGAVATSEGELVGGITFNDSPVTLGGDPPGGIDSPGYMHGYLHAVSLDRWNP